MSEEKANFFWHGQALSLQEQVCISSFVKHNFDVDVYCYNIDLILPAGVKKRNAEEIMPKPDLNKYTQREKKGDLAAFSDVFRYQLLNKKAGWWFDTDVLCVADVQEFIDKLTYKKNKLSLGYQSPGRINGAVLFSEDEAFNSKLITGLIKAGVDFNWGEIGPRLITEVIADLGYYDDVEKSDQYYPIHFSEYKKLLCPEYAEWCSKRTKNALCIHLWSEVSRKNNLPTDKMPPLSSFLHRKYLEICPELVTKSVLPVNIAMNLSLEHRVVREIFRLKDRIRWKLKKWRFVKTSKGRRKPSTTLADQDCCER